MINSFKNWLAQSMIPNVKNSVLLTFCVVVLVLTYIIPKTKK